MASHIAKKQALIEHILGLADGIYRSLEPSIPPEWLSSDLTVAQLRVLLILHTDGQLSMSALAMRLDVAVSTATGIVNNLALKKLIVRQIFEPDRRRVIIGLSNEGQRLVNGLWQMGRSQIASLLWGLTSQQLSLTAGLVQSIFDNAKERSAEPGWPG
jgi:DNA-binding MarR family transcriptional regulator